MTGDQLQVIALFLEILGFGLAFLHIFKPTFSKWLDRKIHIFLTMVGARNMDYAMPGVDYDENLKEEDRTPASIGYLVFMIFLCGSFYSLESQIEFGDGFLWSAAEILVIILITPVTAVVVHLGFATAINLLDSLILKFGNGDYAASFGLIMAAFGVAIEIFQVYESSLNWILFLFIPVLIGLAVFRISIM